MSARPGPAEWIAARTIRCVARGIVARWVVVRVEGLEHLPAHGPVVVACRHYHHLYDAAILLTAISREVHFLVALDWVRGRYGRWVMESACTIARWPFVLRGESPRLVGSEADGAYQPEEALGVARRASRDVTRLMRARRVLVIFPEGYPNVDPDFSPKVGSEDFLPFRPGFARLVARTQRVTGEPVPVLPAGLHYRTGGRWQSGGRWRAVLPFGPPAYIHEHTDLSAFARRIEAEVRALSAVCAYSDNARP